MQRREFLRNVSAAATAAALAPNISRAAEPPACCGPTYATPADAMLAPPETIAFVPCIYVGTGRKHPDYMAAVDVDPDSRTWSKVVERLPMPNVGDELHHFGWNACSSCHADPEKSRRYLVVPGFGSGNIHIIDAADPRNLNLHKVIDGAVVAAKTNLSGPHTVHCLGSGEIMISMLGDGKGDAPGGFLLLDDEFEIKGHWSASRAGMNFNYDFWYQPRHNVMVSSEWAAPNTVNQGFSLEDVKAGKYGQSLHFWDWKERKIAHTQTLGAEGLIPLEVRFHHNPDSSEGFVGAALSSAIWRWIKKGENWEVTKVVQVDPVEVEGWPFPVPGLITDQLLSMDDRFLYFANWLHGDIRQYDISDGAQPKLTGQVWLGGVLKKRTKLGEHTLHGGPQMLQLSLDGKRLYVTNSLYSKWDDQFYPDIGKQGSYMLQLDCDTKNGGLALNEKFYVDFGSEPNGSARAHEIRFPGGDCTSDIWI